MPDPLAPVSGNVDRACEEGELPKLGRQVSASTIRPVLKA